MRRRRLWLNFFQPFLGSSTQACLFSWVSFFVIFRVGLWLGKWHEKYDHHETRLDKIENTLNQTHDTVVSLDSKVDAIYTMTSMHGLARSQSPVALTERGEEISKEIDASTIFSKYQALSWPYFRHHVRLTPQHSTISLQDSKRQSPEAADACGNERVETGGI